MTSERLREYLQRRKLLLGMVHLPPLPGSPGAAGRPPEEIMQQALEQSTQDAMALLDGGMDGFIVENFGDVPFYPDRVSAITAAAIAILADQLHSVARHYAGTKWRRVPFIGVNVLRNDSATALAVAAAAGLDAIRVNVHSGAMVTDQGIVEGRSHETLRERERLGAPVAILADVLVKHAETLGSAAPDPGEWARDTARRAGADALIVTGSATGSPADLSRVKAVREAVPETPLFVGSGVTADTLESFLPHVDGFIVGTSLKKDGEVRASVDEERVRAFVDRARQIR